MRSGMNRPTFWAFVKNVERRLLAEGNFSQSELHDQLIFVWLLNYSITKGIQDLDCAANDLKHFVSKQQLLIICVHSCLFVVKPWLPFVVALTDGGSARHGNRSVFRIRQSEFS